MNRRTLVILALLAMVAGSWWLLNPAQDNDSKTNSDVLDAGYYLIDANIADTDEAGSLIYSLTAKRIDHNPGDDSVRLSNMELTYNNDSQNPWIIDATEGWISGDRQQMIMRGKVNLSGTFEDGQRPATITTTRLLLNVDTSIARTSEPVSIDIKNGQLQAVGLHANLETQKIELLSSVRGTFNSNL